MVIVNPVAGRGRAMRSVGWLRERLLSRPEARVEVTGRFGEAEAFYAGAAARGHDRVIAAGGDGTVQEVVNGLLSVADPRSGFPSTIALVSVAARGISDRPAQRNGGGACSIRVSSAPSCSGGAPCVELRYPRRVNELWT